MRHFIPGVVVVAGILATGWSASSSVANAAPAADDAHAVVEIDYGDGSQRRYTGLRVDAASTVQSLLDAVARHPRGVKYQSRGSGATAFLYELDGVKNQGRNKNWVYRVNGKLGATSFGVAKVKAGDIVRWTYGAYEP